MKKILLLVVAGAALVAFVGVDVVKGAIGEARREIREHLTANVPLKQQLAEARALVDSYAESVIKGEVAAENLGESVAQTEREVKTLERRVGRERTELTSLRRDLEVVPTSTAPRPEEQEAVRRAWAFKAETELLERRRADLDRLKQEHAATLASIEEARTEQARLAQEVQVLAAEIESLDARTAAAHTREAVGDTGVSSSGFAAAQERLARVRTEVREKNKLLSYYEVSRLPVRAGAADLDLTTPTDAREALDEALGTAPASR